MKKLAFGLFSFFIGVGPTMAQDATLLSNWYANISAGNVSALASMIDENAEFKLASGTTALDKQQFLATGFSDISGSAITFEVEGLNTGYAVTVACFDSGSETFSTLDTFNVSAGQITSYSQQRFKNSC